MSRPAATAQVPILRQRRLHLDLDKETFEALTQASKMTGHSASGLAAHVLSNWVRMAVVQARAAEIGSVMSGTQSGVTE